LTAGGCWLLPRGCWQLLGSCRVLLGGGRLAAAGLWGVLVGCASWGGWRGCEAASVTTPAASVTMWSAEVAGAATGLWQGGGGAVAGRWRRRLLLSIAATAAKQTASHSHVWMAVGGGCASQMCWGVRSLPPSWADRLAVTAIGTRPPQVVVTAVGLGVGGAAAARRNGVTHAGGDGEAIERQAPEDLCWLS